MMHPKVTLVSEIHISSVPKTEINTGFLELTFMQKAAEAAEADGIS